MNNKLTLKKCVALFLLLLAIEGHAVPAKPDLMTYELPDGTTISVFLRGDETAHYFTTEDGFVLERGKDGFFRYMIPQSGNVNAVSEVIATDISKRKPDEIQFLKQVNKDATLKNLELAHQSLHQKRHHKSTRAYASEEMRRGTTYPTLGIQKGVAILVEFSDNSFTLEDPLQKFHDQLNKHGYDDFGATGSVKDYFMASSNGVFVPEFDVFGPVKLSNPISYYGGDTQTTTDANAHEMIIEACSLLDDQIDFTQYDRDEDGKIDNVYVFYAGYGQADGGEAYTVWPHSWDVIDAGRTFFFDGVQLGHYACSSELRDGRGQSISGIGVFCHEFTHVLGFPDLYATQYTGAFSPQSWSLMDSGSYNNDSWTPPYMSAYERYCMNWTEPIVLDDPANITMGHVTDKNGIREVYMIKTNLENEYYILENRQQKGWDEFLPGHGMLVWHIDYDEVVWDGNVVNNTPAHQHVDIEEADNDISYYSIPGDVFPGTANVTSFTDDTQPSMKTWAGVPLYSPITDIKESEEGIISFVFKGGVDYFDAMVAHEAAGIEADKATASWEKVTQATSYLLSVYTKADNGDIMFVGNYNRMDVGDVATCEIEGLFPLTTYYYVVYATDGMFTSKASNEVEFTTDEPTLKYMSVTATHASQISDTGFKAYWEKLSEADRYTLTVYTSQLGEPEYETLDFTGKLEAFPDTWSTSCTGTYAMSSLCGESAPSLKMDTDQDYLQTPSYKGGVRIVEFWYRGSGVEAENALKLYAMTNNKWEEIYSISPISTVSGGTNVSLEVDPKYKSLKWVYEKPGAGNVAIDDIKIGYGGKMEDLPVAGFTDVEVGDVDCYVVEGLEALGLYSFSVLGHNSEFTTMPGNRFPIQLSAGVGNINTDEATKCRVADGVIYVSTVSPDSEVVIYDTLGRMLSRNTQPQGTAQYTIEYQGVVVVKVNNETFRLVL